MTNMDPETEEGRANIAILLMVARLLHLLKIDRSTVQQAIDTLGFDLPPGAADTFTNDIHRDADRKLSDLERKMFIKG